MCEVDVKIIKRTQETLGKLIKKPVLTEKLLSRPPFRFLHDICTSVIRSTGLMKGLFNSEELEADNVKDKDKKLAFLQKLVDFLSAVHERTIPVRIMSIVAGKEAEKTNEMLFLLAEAVNKKINNEEYVARVLQGSKVDDVKSSAVGKQVSETKHSKKKPGMESKFVDHRTKVTQSRRKNKSNGEKVNEIENKLFVDNSKVHMAQRHSKYVVQKYTEQQSDLHLFSQRRLEDSTDPVNVEKCGSARENHLFQDSGSRAGSQCGLQTPEKSQEEIVAPSLQNSEVSVFQPRHHRPASAKGQRVKRDDVKMSTDQQDNKREPTENSRLVPPRPRRSGDFVIEDNHKQVNMTCISGLIISDSQQDTTDEEHDDDNNDDKKFVSEETPGNISADILTKQWDKTEPEDNHEHGGLVTKILQTKKEYENVNTMNKESLKVQSSGLNEAAKEREKALLKKEINRLCDSLQTLSRSAIPLSKLMDFVQEDLETMQQEYERWKTENHILKSQLKQQENLTQTSIEPLKAQLDELEKYAKEKEKAIIKCKAKIFHNNERIQNLLFKSLEKVL